MKREIKNRIIMVIMALVMCCGSGHAISFSLDSIAEWGKFPRFCVNTYRWGDQFFNGYDTAFVKGAGYKFNAKLRTDSWIDYYNFYLPDKVQMRMLSDPSTSVGMWLTYLAVSVGYDKNVSKFFGSSAMAREQFQFGFNCSLFAFNLYYIDNDIGTKIKKFGKRGSMINPNLDFGGAHTKSFGTDLYYFFDHKHYSQAAAFNFSRIQIRSRGSWFAGFSYWWRKFDFDFSSLPDYIKEAFPNSWVDYKYTAQTRNFAVKFGYGYNWVFAHNWLFSISVSPVIGLKKGFINSETERTTFALSETTKMSLVWNHGRWFAGAIGDFNLGIVYDKDSTFENAVISGNISLGYRFNIW